MSPLTVDLQEHTAVVTGAASGIGAAVARTLGVAGARVVAADLDQLGATATARAISDGGGQAHGFAVDITDRDSVRALRASVESAFEPASILVNCAGWNQPQRFIENAPDFWDKVIAINLMGPVNVTREFLDPMIERDSGRIVNVASDAGRVGSSQETVYAGAKGGVIAFTKSLAREVARHHICVNCVCPGPTDTQLFRRHTEKMQEALTRAIPFRRLAVPDDIAPTVVFFASDAAAYITGQVLSVSGGLTMAG
jgi:2-hydroxycyclohexanecarboxyl-CoA dehydrogenase